MKVLIMVFLVLFFCPFANTYANSNELNQSLEEYFLKIKKQYDSSKNWSSKLKIYSVLFVEFSDLFKANVQEDKQKTSWYYLGLSSGFLDLAYHLSFLEDGLYEGEWIKSSGIVLKEKELTLYKKMIDLISAEKMDYYSLELHERQKKVETVFFQWVKLLETKMKEKNLFSEEKQIFLSGYLNSFLFFISLNQYLDNQLKLEVFLKQTLKIMRP